MDATVTGPDRLSRNRNYNILWSGMLLSELCGAVAAIAFPLLVLAASGSALQLSVVAAVLAATSMAANVPAGVIADRYDRRAVMLVCQGMRIAAMASLAVTLAFGSFEFWHLLVVAMVEGAAGAAFAPAEDAALPQVVPSSQLATAVARNTARPHLANLAGPVAAGFAFGIHPMGPFALNVVALLCSFLALLFLVLPRRERPAGEGGTVGADLRRGLRWVAGQRIIRSTLVWLMFNQLFFSALVVVVLYVSGAEGVPPSETGLMMTCFGAGGVLGALVASRLVDLLPSPVIVIGFSWVGAGFTALMSIVPAGLPLGLVLAGIAFFVPVAATTILTYQMIVTPDELRGKLSGAVGLCTDGASALGPMAGGLVLLAGGASTSLLLCAASLAAVALGSLLSPTLRRFPPVRGQS